MGQISDARLQLVRGLIEQAPDSAVRDLAMALSAGQGRDEGLQRVYGLVEAEASDRRLRNRAFVPIAPLCAEPDPLRALVFPPRTLGLLWKALKTASGARVAACADAARSGRGPAAAELDALCALSAEGLRASDNTFAAVASAAEAGSGRLVLAACLDIAPLTRQALAHLPDWLGRITDEKAAQLRLTYRDVVAVSEDAGPRFFDMLAAHLSEPWEILRVISGMMDHPAEAYLSASELAAFPVRVMDDIDARLVRADQFQAHDGRQAAHEAAALVHIIAVEITECEQSIQLAPDGPWGRRVSQQKRRLAAMAESHLGAIEEAIDLALPVQTVRRGAKALHAVPRLANEPDPAAVDKAAALLAFLSEVRSSATAGGFASARAKALEAADARIDTYVEDLLDDLRNAVVASPERARAYLDIAAEFCGLVRDEQAARIVRRRAAAA